MSAKINDGLTASQRHYLRNREAVLAKTRRRQKLHPELCRVYSRQYRLRKYGPRVIKTREQRFLEKVEPITETGCWIWMGTWQKNGYGRVSFEPGRSGLVHRWSYLHFCGEIPNDKEVDHICHVRCCVNPAHLRVITHDENMKARHA